MMNALSLYLPSWSTDRIRRRLLPDSSIHRTAIVLTVLDRERTLVAACCAMARSAGILNGMPLAEAQAMLRQSAHIAPLCPADDFVDLQRLARWAYRFVPIVAVDGTNGLLLDARGCDHLYKGIDRLAKRLLKSLHRARIKARLAAGPTFGSAWALARFGPNDTFTVVNRSQLDESLAGLPIAALRISSEALDALRAVGVERIGQLRALPRSSLVSRYGPEVLLQLDRAFGNAIETVVPIQPRWPTFVERLFDGPTDRLESISLATRGLLTELSAKLVAAQRGSLSLRVELIRSDIEPLLIPVRTSQPSSDPSHLWKLLAPKLEKAHLGFGVEGVRLVVLWSKRLKDRQATCWPTSQEQSPEVSQLLDTLHARLTPEQVLRPIAVESYIPEKAFAFTPVFDDKKEFRHSTAALPCDRPTVILTSPLPIDVSLLAPDGPMVTIRLRGASSGVRSCIGPERVSGEWWKSGSSCRDYFKVQTEDGRWFWIFRSGTEGGRWFLHGEWA